MKLMIFFLKILIKIHTKNIPNKLPESNLSIKKDISQDIIVLKIIVNIWKIKIIKII